MAYQLTESALKEFQVICAICHCDNCHHLNPDPDKGDVVEVPKTVVVRSDGQMFEEAVIGEHGINYINPIQTYIQ